MDVAVALVDIYLRINGYFTVTEFPVVERVHGGVFRSATDLDMLAFRFPGGGRLVSRPHGKDFTVTSEVDAALCAPVDKADMLIGEVKEGRGHLNEAMRDPAVLEATLLRFGCCTAEHIPRVVQELLRHGEAETHCGHKVRMVVFGAINDTTAPHKYHFVPLGHVADFMSRFVETNYQLVRQAQFKDPTFNLLVMLEKGRRGLAASAS